MILESRGAVIESITGIDKSMLGDDYIVIWDERKMPIHIKRSAIDYICSAMYGGANINVVPQQAPQQNVDADNMLTGALKTLFAVAENYPDLKANQNFLNLQDELTNTENKIAYSRQHFNDSVLVYNNLVETIPGKWFAGFMNKKTREMLQIPDAAREVPKVKF